MRRTRKAPKINTKLLVDIIVASIIVDKAPAFINQIMPVNPAISQFTGIGAGWLTGWMANRPDISNASIALGVTSFINPMVDQVTAGVTTGMIPGGSGTIPIKRELPIKKDRSVISDYISLNDYVKTPGTNEDYSVYSQSY